MRDIETRLQASMHDQLDDLRLPDRLSSIRHRARRQRALFATGASLLVVALAVASAWGLNAWSGPDREQSVVNPAPNPSDTARFARFRITFRGGTTDATGIVEIGAAMRTACFEAHILGATSGHLHRYGQQSPVITFFDGTYRPSHCVRDQDADTLQDIIDNPDDYYIEFHNSASGGTLTARLEPAGSMLGCRGDTPPRFGTENLGFIPGQARSEGGNEVLPIVFPDGSTAELVYPTDLQLDQLSVRPDLTGGAPGEMVRPQIYYGDSPSESRVPLDVSKGATVSPSLYGAGRIERT